MKNLKVLTKLVVVFLVIMSLVIGSNWFNTRQLERLDTEVAFMYDAAFQLARSASATHADMEAALKFMYNTLATDDPNVVAVASASLRASIGDYEAHLDEVRGVNDYIQSAREGGPQAVKIAQAVAELERAHSDFVPYQERVLGYADSEMNREEGFDYLEDIAIPYANALLAELEELVELADASAHLSLTEYRAVENTTRLAMGAIGVAIGVILLLLGVVIARGISVPIKEISGAAAKMAAGDLSTEVNYTSRDELGQLADSMRYMIKALNVLRDDIDYVLGGIAQGDLTVDNSSQYIGDFTSVKAAMQQILDTLNETVGGIYRASEEVSSGAEQVSDAAQHLASGASEQAASIQQFSAAIGEVRDQARQNNEAADNTLRAVDTATDLTRASVASMEQMNEAMAHIDASSQNIAKIIKVIEDIAFQTNILSLNAAVEAARAGSAGKGFAVVADEVRTLAAKSAEAAKETTELIESSLRSVEHGNAMARATSDSLQRVSEVAEGIVGYMQTLSAASQQQATSIDEVTEGIDQISAVIQANSATAEQSAASSEELSGQASILRSLVAQFKTLRRASDPYEPVLYAEPEAVHYPEELIFGYADVTKYGDIRPVN